MREISNARVTRVALVAAIALVTGLAPVGVGGCSAPSASEPRSTPGAGVPTATVATTTPDEASATPRPPAEQDDAPKPAPTHNSSDGSCDPMPKEGTPCTSGDGYCVESWGTPGGRSSALWCRGGRWEREEEDNLP